MPTPTHREGRLLFVCAVILVLIGVMMVYSASSVIALRKHGGSSYFLLRQLAWLVIGAGLMVFVSRIPYRLWQAAVAPLTLGCLLMLGLVLIPGVGQRINGAQRWIEIGPVTFQPSEFAKLGLVIFLAHYLSKGPNRLGDFARGLLPALAVVGAGVLLILREPDLGTAVSLGLVAFLMLFAGGARLRHLGALVLCMLPLLAYLVVGTEYRWRRLQAFWDPWQDPSGMGFQIIQSFLALGSGGQFGVGLGEGRQKLFYLPHPHTDFIFSVIGEELGLLGTLGVLACFALLVASGVRLAARLEEPFGQFLVLGLTLTIGVGALLNLAVATGLLPTKGLALPFVSYGGSALVANLIGIGLLWNVAKGGGRP